MPTGHLEGSAVLLQGTPRPTALYVDCSRHSGIEKITGSAECAVAKLGWALRTKMDQMPTDDNCKAVNYILHRKSRRWYKCCSQGAMSALGVGWKCIEVTPSAWFPQRGKSGEVLPFNHKEAQECFSVSAPDFFNCEDGYCTHRLEQCVVLNERGKRSHWAFGEKELPGVQVYLMAMPPTVLEPLDRRRPLQDGSRFL
mmetsp:Transcript_78233/g.176805  ORF Transcript_78233/g.176805 Transcript_78233/m.176805 type:complete len:198 (+) Transcript_78233:84-677(+)